MATHNAGSIWLRVSVVYFVLAVLLGIVMGASGDHSLFPLHAHLNLLGWVSMAVFGLIYRQYPEMADNRLAKAQFWLYNTSLPVMMIALGGMLKGNATLEPVVGVGSVVVGLAVLLFAVNVLVYLPKNLPEK